MHCWRNRGWQILTLIVAVSGFTQAASAQATLTNGYSAQGVISSIGHTDSWTFNATAGNPLIIRCGLISTTNNFVPRLELRNPSNSLIASNSASVVELALTTATSGTYTLAINDGSSAGTGTGEYRIKQLQPSTSLVIPPGDDGGTLINGGMHIGTIDFGDMDAWTFPAVSGDNLVIRMGETTTNSPLTPYLRLYSPDGTLVATTASSVATEISFRATNNGNFTVIATDQSSGLTGTGNYRINLGKTSGNIIVSPADEGGAMTGVSSYSGMIDVGDLDLWSFNVCAGDLIQLQLTESLAGSPLTPWLRLYGRDGDLLDSVSNSISAQISRVAPASGRYIAIAADGSSGLTGSGSYVLSVNGLASGLKFCPSTISGTNLILQGVGGTPNGTAVLYQSTNVANSIGLWIPVATNQFDSSGAYLRTNGPATLRQQFFRLAEPH